MRAKTSRRACNQPARSPSPDVVHKSIIVSTQSPLAEVKEFIRKSASRSPHRMTIDINSSSVPMDDERARLTIQDLQQKLYDMENKYFILLEQNKLLNKEASALKDIMKRGGDSSVVTQNQSYQKILKEFNVRVIALSDQNKRLITRIQQEISKNNKLTEENHELRAKPFKMDNIDQSHNVNELKAVFLQNANIITAKYEKLTQDRYRQMNAKLDKLMYIQGIIQARISRNQYLRSPLPESSKPKDVSTDHGPSLIDSRYTVQPFSPYQAKEDENIKKLELKKLENQVQFLHIQLEQEKKKSNALEDRIRSLMAPCQQCLVYQKQIKDLLEGKKDEQLKRTYSQTQFRKENDILKRKIAILEEENKRIQDSSESRERQHREQILKKDEYINNYLKDYLRMITQIRNSINIEGIDQVIAQNETIIEEKLTIEERFQYFKIQNEAIINELKKKILFQSEYIIELEKDVENYKATIDQLQSQKIKLKKAITDYSTAPHAQITKQQQQKITKKITQTRSIPLQQKCKAKDCFKQTLEKLNLLESKIHQTLRE